MILGRRARRRRLQELVDSVPYWYHSIDLGAGVVTPGGLHETAAQIVAGWPEARLTVLVTEGEAEGEAVEDLLARGIEVARPEDAESLLFDRRFLYDTVFLGPGADTLDLVLVRTQPQAFRIRVEEPGGDGSLNADAVLAPWAGLPALAETLARAGTGLPVARYARGREFAYRNGAS